VEGGAPREEEQEKMGKKREKKKESIHRPESTRSIIEEKEARGNREEGKRKNTSGQTEKCGGEAKIQLTSKPRNSNRETVITKKNDARRWGSTLL